MTKSIAAVAAARFHFRPTPRCSRRLSLPALAAGRATRAAPAPRLPRRSRRARPPSRPRTGRRRSSAPLRRQPCSGPTRSSPSATGFVASSPAAAWARSTRPRTSSWASASRSRPSAREATVDRRRRRALQARGPLARRVTHPNVCRIFDLGFHAPPSTGASRGVVPHHGAARGRDAGRRTCGAAGR